jgi:hypothetical protein
MSTPKTGKLRRTRDMCALLYPHFPEAADQAITSPWTHPGNGYGGFGFSQYNDVLQI